MKHSLQDRDVISVCKWVDGGSKVALLSEYGSAIKSNKKLAFQEVFDGQLGQKSSIGGAIRMAESSAKWYPDHRMVMICIGDGNFEKGDLKRADGDISSLKKWHKSNQKPEPLFITVAIGKQPNLSSWQSIITNMMGKMTIRPEGHKTYNLLIEMGSRQNARDYINELVEVAYESRQGETDALQLAHDKLKDMIQHNQQLKQRALQDNADQSANCQAMIDQVRQKFEQGSIRDLVTRRDAITQEQKTMYQIIEKQKVNLNNQNGDVEA